MKTQLKVFVVFFAVISLDYNSKFIYSPLLNLQREFRIGNTLMISIMTMKNITKIYVPH